MTGESGREDSSLDCRARVMSYASRAIGLGSQECERVRYLRGQEDTRGAMTALLAQLTCTLPRIGEKAQAFARAGRRGRKKVLQRCRGKLAVRTVGLVHHLPTLTITY
jgi:hypothetical protein